MTRIVILGGPKTGKTTLASNIAQAGIAAGYGDIQREQRYEVSHTDDLIPLGWSEASQAASAWFDEPGPWIIEGVAAVRALRKWRDQHPGERPPVDRVIYLDVPHAAPSRGQAAMAAGHHTVWLEVAPWLREHGISVEYSPHVFEPPLPAPQVRASDDG